MCVPSFENSLNSFITKWHLWLLLYHYEGADAHISIIYLSMKKIKVHTKPLVSILTYYMHYQWIGQAILLSNKHRESNTDDKKLCTQLLWPLSLTYYVNLFRGYYGVYSYRTLTWTFTKLCIRTNCKLP